MSIMEDLNQADKDVLVARAITWWECNRPIDWSEDCHLMNPTVNCTSDEDSDMARAVAAVVRGRQDDDPFRSEVVTVRLHGLPTRFQGMVKSVEIKLEDAYVKEGIIQ